MIPAIPPLMILGRIEKVCPPVGAAGAGTDVTGCEKNQMIKNSFDKNIILSTIVANS